MQRFTYHVLVWELQQWWLDTNLPHSCFGWGVTVGAIGLECHHLIIISLNLCLLALLIGRLNTGGLSLWIGKGEIIMQVVDTMNYSAPRKEWFL